MRQPLRINIQISQKLSRLDAASVPLRHKMQSARSVLASTRKQTAAMTYETFCGGMFETNCYLVSAPEGWIIFDAPDWACDWLESRQVDLKLLLLAHGHIDP